MANYINNKDFFDMLVEFQQKCKEAEEQNKPVPRIPEKIGLCFMMIAKKLSNKGNFVGYSYKDEMVSDALENCVVAIHSFNPEKSQNPFAYFTQIIWWAFLRRIEKEKKQTYVKYKTLENLMIENSGDEFGDEYVNFDLANEKMTPIIEKFEKSKEAKAKAPKGLEKFVSGE
jgi:hypothetical protein